jgi:hypothetical protein
MKKYFKTVFKNKRNELFKLSTSVFPQIKIYETTNNSLELESDGKRIPIIEQDSPNVDLTLKLSKGKSYYSSILESVSNQIASHIYKTITEL